MEKTFILEDHQLMQEVFSNLLKEAYPNTSTTIANTLALGLQHINQERVDLALVDLSLPDGSGIELIHQLKRNQPDCYIVVVTIFDDDAHLFQALEAGADGYLLKDQSQEKLIAALKGISAGEPPLSPSIAKKLISRFSKRTLVQAECNLSDRELEVLKLIAQGHKRSSVAATLSISENTVAAHIKSIYKKLNISSRAEASIEASKLGLLPNH